MMTRLLTTTALIITGSCFVSVGMAQVVIPGSAQPGRIEQSIQAPMVPDGPEATAMPEAQPQQAVPGAEKITLTLNSVTLKNSSVYGDADISPYYAKMVGEEVTLADVYALANRLTTLYREDGYIMSRVILPTQNITGGDVVFEAVEGFIDEINFEFPDGEVDIRTQKFFNKMAYEIKQSQPLTARTLERYLLLMGDLPGIDVNAVVKPSETTPKAADLFVVVNKKSADAYVSADNRGSRYVGPLQLQAGLSLNDIFGHTDTLKFRAATTGQTRELQFIEGQYTHQICPNGCKLDITASHTRSKPGHTLEAFNVESENTTVEATLSYPVWRARAENLNVHGTFSYKDLQTDAGGSALNEDHIRALRIGADWNKADRHLGVTSAEVEISQGLDMFGATDNTGMVAQSRNGAEANFLKVYAKLAREQMIPSSAFSFYGAVEGQFTENNLHASEQLGLGGSDFGRGYDPSEITGDTGVAATLEGRYTQYPQSVNWLSSTQYYAFYDAGMVRNKDLAAGQSTTRQTLTSTGVGVRLATKDALAFNLEIAKPLTRDVAVEGDKDPRAFFKITKEF